MVYNSKAHSSFGAALFCSFRKKTISGGHLKPIEKLTVQNTQKGAFKNTIKVAFTVRGN